MTPKREYGLLIERPIPLYGTDYVTARLISREIGGEHPLGISEMDCYDRPKHLVDKALDGLGLYGFVSEYNDNAYIGYDACYRDVGSVELPIARKMVNTLSLITKRRAKESAYEAGDTLMSLAKALKLSFVVERKGTRAGSSYADMDWRWMTIEEGRNRFREIIAETAKDAKARKAA